jgi:osmotically-inducible protein OsmY
MPRALAGATAAILAIFVGVSASKAQVPAPQRQGQQTPVRKDYDSRLEELKVELALLSDPGAFPYSVAASTREGALELYGFVPNDRVRQYVLDVARRSTTLKVHDALGLQPKPTLQSSPRPASVLQKEGTELLQQEMGETAKQVSLEARPNGMIVLNGCIDSVENQVKISRLFRQLSGCGGVVNKLTVEPIVRDGKRVVRVTRDGSLLVSPSALGMKEPIAAGPSPQPTLLLTNHPSTPKSEQSLPTIVPPKPPSPPLKPAPLKVGTAADPFAPSKLPVKWGRPANGWETQANELEELQKAREQALMPTPIKTQKQPAEPKKAPASVATIKPSRPIGSPPPHFAESRPAPVSSADVTWRRPGGSEESEPKILPPTRDANASAKSLPSLRSSRRWPPAYVTGPPPSQGRPGIIVFDDDPRPTQPAPAAAEPSRPIVPADLQRRVKLLCGQEARDVTVATQRDGSMLVKVKVANRSIETQLSRKILDLPEMTSPQVRLLMEVGP